jgi:crossover junction endodeoxyribonuclease RuvC
MHFLGIDPGLRSLGYAVVNIEQDAPVEIGVLRTKKDPLLSSPLDTACRVRHLYRALIALTKEHEFQAVCLESMSHVRSAAAAAKLAMTVGMIIGLSEGLGVPVMQLSPQAVRKTLLGSPKAEKTEIAAVMHARYGEISGLARITPSQRNHAYDALAVASAVLRLTRTTH